MIITFTLLVFTILFSYVRIALQTASKLSASPKNYKMLYVRVTS
ncbi:hypothetical protein [Aquimarina litoralis]|nr:hypothetical protein [Aquimarina litoralis]